MKNFFVDFEQLTLDRFNDFKSDAFSDDDIFNVHFELYDGSIIDFYECNRSLPLKQFDFIDISKIRYFYFYRIGVEI